MNRMLRMDPGRLAALEAMNADRARIARDEIHRNRRAAGWRRRFGRGA